MAAELNFHYNDPDPEFFRICREEGTRIVMGSDAHQLREVGDLQPHLRLLRQIGAPLPISTPFPKREIHIRTAPTGILRDSNA